MQVSVSVHMAGWYDADMMEEEEDGHHLGVRARAGALISVLYSIMPILYHCLAPHIAVVLGKCVCPAPELEEMGSTPNAHMLPCPVNLNLKCSCLCALCDYRAALPKQLLMASTEN